MKRLHWMLVLLLVMSLGSLNTAFASDAWLESAQLGPYQPEQEDWDAIYEAAKEEGKVVVYAATGAIHGAAEQFMAMYPGITVEAYDMRALELLEKTRREVEAGINNADVLVVGSPEIIRQTLEPLGAVTNYLPRYLQDVIPERFQYPYPVQRLNILGWTYNTDEFEEPPFTNWWELTEPEWRGRVMHDSPARSFSVWNFANVVVQHADELEAAYERFYGKPIELTTENAGYEYLKRLLENSVIGNGSRSMAEGVSNSQGPFAALVVYSLRGEAEPGGPYNFEFIYDADPIMGYAWGEHMFMLTEAQNPNASKMMIKFLLDEGYSTFARNPSPRTDLEPPHPYRRVDEMDVWTVDLDFAIDHGDDVLDFWMIHQ